MINSAIRTTLSLPEELLQEIDRIVTDGKVKSRNEFIARAIGRELAWQQRQEIDAACAEMARDLEYQATVRQMDAEFATASWEALVGESN